jgi:hypothetical protein
LRVVACLGARLALLGHCGDLGGFARVLARLNCPVSLRIRLIKDWLALAFGFFFVESCLYHGHIAKFERIKIFITRLKPKNTRVAYRDTTDTTEARGIKEER